MWQYPPRSILVAVDFGEAAARALRVAQAMAARHKSAITAIHAETIEVPPYFTHDQLRDVARRRAETRRAAQHYLERFVHEFAPGAESVLVDGPAVAAILATAQRHDLVMLGTHGRRGPSLWWVGSVAERVVRDSQVPTLVVRAESAPSPGEQVFSQPVAVAGPEFHGEARHYAEILAGSFGGTLGETPVGSLHDLTCAKDASLMVVAIGRHHGGSWFGDAAERLVRSCSLPMLFVPNRA
jgi:nucleotide-binding universal stress UspA family protein